MGLVRRCSKTGCNQVAVATLTYVYRDSTVVVGPLATDAEPHTYDLCAEHAERLTVPRGWEVVRLAGDYVAAEPTQDDLLALADAVREAGRPRTAEATRPSIAPVPRADPAGSGSGSRSGLGAAPGAPGAPGASGQPGPVRGGSLAPPDGQGSRETGRRGHLRILREL